MQKDGEIGHYLQRRVLSHISEASGLSRDQFIRVPKTQKWYDMYAEKEFSRSKMHCWTKGLPDATVPSRELLDSHYLQHGLSGLYPRIHSGNGIGWPGTSHLCLKQAARLSQCWTKVQDSMAYHLNVIQSDKAKRKSTKLWR